MQYITKIQPVADTYLSKQNIRRDIYLRFAYLSKRSVPYLRPLQKYKAVYIFYSTQNPKSNIY